MAELNIERFVDLSGAVSLEGIDWSQCAASGITNAEARILRYMADTETHTILYLRDLLAGHGAHDPEITSFLSVWVYEELWHGRAIDRMLAACGHAPDPNRFTAVSRGITLRERTHALLSMVTANATPRFVAVHMTWGALNELTAAAAYTALSNQTDNPELKKLLTRIAKQERKHYSFYYQQAYRRLEGDVAAQRLTRFMMNRIWKLVGTGVAGERNMEFVAATLFSEESTRKPLYEAEQKIARLPGLQGFARVVPEVAAYASRGRAAALAA